ncbi:hypothetical protein ACIBL8_44135 [Streptomyces sp. NPDC050523]|uniref:hypothetical protein n=1 Tax=Streptomyces sp. NPDC050523 TaxID=3365622 RepID=UPI0037AC7C97
MMRWLILGALLGLLLLYPALLAAVVTIAAAVLGKPLLVAFVAGLATRPYLPRARRWAR